MAIKEHFIPVQTDELQSTYIKPEVLAEIKFLSERGFDVATTDTFDEYKPPYSRQIMIDERVRELEEDVAGAEKFRRLPGISAWSKLTKRAIALHTLYHPDGSTVGEGVDISVYDRPIMSGQSAKEVLISAKGKEKANKIIQDYTSFIEQIIDNGDARFIGSRDYFMGVADARAVRTRATAAMEIAEEHITNNPELDGENLISASLACGAAGPVYKLVRGLEDRGRGFKKVILVDGDPMALATAASLAENDGLEDKVELQLRNLLLEPLTNYIDPNSVDIVDLLGLFEYLPSEMGIALLQSVKDIVKPGGLIVFGNMLKNRPQQAFFGNVVQWPNLEQREMSKVLDMIEEAGFDLKKVKVRVPSEGVYAVYAIDVNGKPEKEKLNQEESVIQALGITATDIQEY